MASKLALGYLIAGLTLIHLYYMLKSSCAMCFISFKIKSIDAGAFFVIKYPYTCKLKVLKIRKVLSLVDFRSLCQLLHS